MFNAILVLVIELGVPLIYKLYVHFIFKLLPLKLYPTQHCTILYFLIVFIVMISVFIFLVMFMFNSQPETRITILITMT